MQSKIDGYKDVFFRQSGGFHLPEVRYLGKFEKTQPQNQFKDNHIYISIPIKNQEEIIVKVLITLFQNTKHNLVIGLLFDNCTDESLSNVKKFLNSEFLKFSNVITIYLVKSSDELFEATCENILFQFCESDYFLSLQSDIFFEDPTFIARSLTAFNKLPNLFAISGRAVVPFRQITRIDKILEKIIRSTSSIRDLKSSFTNKKILGAYIPKLSYYGDISNMPFKRMSFSTRQMSTLYVGEAIIRGPIIWSSKIFRKLGGLNDVSYFLGRDDCDLCLRAYRNGYVVGYLPSTSFSIPSDGTTRKPITNEVATAMQIRMQISNSNPGELYKLWQKPGKKISLSFLSIRYLLRGLLFNQGKFTL
jgi:GT2 family glycosyltransferase